MRSGKATTHLPAPSVQARRVNSRVQRHQCSSGCSDRSGEPGRLSKQGSYQTVLGWKTGSDPRWIASEPGPRWVCITGNDSARNQTRRIPCSPAARRYSWSAQIATGSEGGAGGSGPGRGSSRLAVIQMAGRSSSRFSQNAAMRSAASRTSALYSSSRSMWHPPWQWRRTPVLAGPTNVSYPGDVVGWRGSALRPMLRDSRPQWGLAPNTHAHCWGGLARDRCPCTGRQANDVAGKSAPTSSQSTCTWLRPVATLRAQPGRRSRFHGRPSLTETLPNSTLTLV